MSAAYAIGVAMIFGSMVVACVGIARRITPVGPAGVLYLTLLVAGALLAFTSAGTGSSDDAPPCPGVELLTKAGGTFCADSAIAAAIDTTTGDGR